MAIVKRTKFRIKKGIASKKLDGTLYLLDPNKGHLHTLNESAEVIWRCIRNNLSFEEIVRQITDEFNVSPQIAKKDAKTFLGMLVKLKVLTTSPKTGT